jgi:dethiobiotin synthetase
MDTARITSNFFITGTDTGVGKTWVTSWLVRSWRARGQVAAAMKPISTGDREDARVLRAASGEVLSLDEINPVHFRDPVCPLQAARNEDREIDFADLNRRIESLRQRFFHFAVEGVGGWRVPLAPNYEVRDWVRALGLPVLVVARGTVGTLNHTLLTVESIRAAGLICAGVVVNAGPAPGGPAPGGPALGAEALPDLDLARRQNVLLLREILLLPVFELESGSKASGEIPFWLGGK